MDPRPADAQQLAEFVGAAEPRLPRARRRCGSSTTTPAGFEWIEGGAANENVIAFLRYDRDRRPLAVRASTSPAARTRASGSACRCAGRWREVLNTDAAEFGGSGVGNLGGVDATDDPWVGRPASAVFTLPPLAAVWFALER